MNGRLVFAIISTGVEEAVIAALVVWGLPRLNMRIPVWGLALIMVAWVGYSIFTYRMGSCALKADPVVGLENMVGTSGEVVCPLAPEGLVRIRGELWAAKSETGKLVDTGRIVMVVAQERLKLIVRETVRESR